MPITKSAKKFMKSSKKKQVRNFSIKRRMKDLTKKTREHIRNGDLEKAKEFSRKAFQMIDKAGQKKVIKKNKVNRKKRQLSRDLKQAETGSKK